MLVALTSVYAIGLVCVHAIHPDAACAADGGDEASLLQTKLEGNPIHVAAQEPRLDASESRGVVQSASGGVDMTLADPWKTERGKPVDVAPVLEQTQAGLYNDVDAEEDGKPSIPIVVIGTSAPQAVGLPPVFEIAKHPLGPWHASSPRLHLPNASKSNVSHSLDADAVGIPETFATPKPEQVEDGFIHGHLTRAKEALHHLKRYVPAVENMVFPVFAFVCLLIAMFVLVMSFQDA